VAIVRDGLLDVPYLAQTREERDRARAEERTAAGRMYADHLPRIHRFLRDVLGDPALAADATQETFLRAMRAARVVDDGRPIAPWLFGIARNVSLEIRRARFRAGRVITYDDEGAGRHPAPGSPETDLLGREALEIVGAALLELSEERRAMLVLRLDHGLPYEEIAAVMGVSLAKVKVEIHRAREVLRAVMREYDGGRR
jgi:RNA polymerase sigma-70 factor (ECF subfamily)